MKSSKTICCQCGGSNYKELIEKSFNRNKVLECLDCQSIGLINHVAGGYKMAFFRNQPKDPKRKENRFLASRVRKSLSREVYRKGRLDKAELKPYNYEEILEAREETEIRIELLKELTEKRAF